MGVGQPVVQSFVAVEADEGFAEAGGDVDGGGVGGDDAAGLADEFDIVLYGLGFWVNVAVRGGLGELLQQGGYGGVAEEDELPLGVFLGEVLQPDGDVFGGEAAGVGGAEEVDGGVVCDAVFLQKGGDGGGGGGVRGGRRRCRCR